MPTICPEQCSNREQKTVTPNHVRLLPIWNITPKLGLRLTHFNLGTFLQNFTLYSMLALIRGSNLGLC